jgi:hypothetical protein
VRTAETMTTGSEVAAIADDPLAGKSMIGL